MYFFIMYLFHVEGVCLMHDFVPQITVNEIMVVMVLIVGFESLHENRFNSKFAYLYLGLTKSLDI